MTGHEFSKQVSVIPRMKQSKVGSFKVIPFKVPHSETECDGFLISHDRLGKLLFITDAEMCPYDMSGQEINHLMIECNYSMDYMPFDAINKHHVIQGHMELQTCKRFIRTVYGESLKTIGLLHLSNEHADSERFRKEIECEFPKCRVWVASKGKTIDLEEGELL